MNSFSVEQKRVDVFESAAPNKPVIYLNTYGREGAQIFQYLTDIGCQDFSLVAVSKLEWNHDMVPCSKMVHHIPAEPMSTCAF